MKKYIVMAMLVVGLTGTTALFAQDGPKTDKKEMKSDKKENKMVKKEYHGSERSAGTGRYG